MRVLHGQALLISVLVLSTVLLGIGLLSVTMLVTSSQSMITLANKRIAAAAATACMESAINRLGRNGSYVGNETLTVASTTCSIRPIVVSSTPIVIEVWASVANQFARERAILSNRSPIVISSWIEVPQF
ncbi:MAG: hypothetical protein AAB879_02825 [Patescibacteria group bacterium]